MRRRNKRGEMNMKNTGKKQYILCMAEVLKLENEDVLTASSGVLTSGSQSGSANFSIDMDEIFKS